MTVWCLGSINLDLVYHLPHRPDAGETLAATAHSTGLGGKGANQAIAAARAGARVRFIGAVGQGGEPALAPLGAAGVDTAHVARLDGVATGHALILLTPDGENSIVIYPGANRALTPDPAAIAAMAPGDTLLIQNETNLQAETAAAARARGVRVVYSAAPFAVEAVRAMLPHATLLAMNAGEAAAVAAALGPLPAGLSTLVTRGADGATFRDAATGTDHDAPAFAVTPVDTTGAGDCFAGTLAAGLDAGLPIPAALRRASAAAAITVTRPGAAGAIPTAAEVDAFLTARP